MLLPRRVTQENARFDTYNSQVLGENEKKFQKEQVVIAIKPSKPLLITSR